jgi:purine-binding chemotaxis protein CheW
MGAAMGHGTGRAHAVPDGGSLSPESTAVQLLAFELSGRRLALPVEVLDTIVWAVAVTPLPHAPPFVEGLINLRGHVVPVIDLRRRFGLPTVPVSLDQRFVVARSGRRTLALRVDHVHTVMTVQPDAIEGAGRVVPGARHAAGIVRLADGVIVIQDLERLLSSEEEARLADALAARTTGPSLSNPAS